MEEYRKILIQRNVEKSDEAMKGAELELKNNLLTNALNRTYYAVFYIVTALARKYSFVTSKHTSLMGWFNKKFIYEMKRFDEDMKDIYSNAFKLRQENDYDDSILPNYEQIEELIKEAKLFIETVKKEIYETNSR